MKIETTEEIDAVNGELNKALARNRGRFLPDPGAVGGGSRTIAGHKIIGAA